MEAPLLGGGARSPLAGKSRALVVASVASLAVLAFVAAVAVTRGAPVSLVGLVSSPPMARQPPSHIIALLP